MKPYYSVMPRDRVLNEDGTSHRGLSHNKICVGMATNKRNTIAEGYGKPSQKMSYDSFIKHISSGATLVLDKESTHKKTGQRTVAYERRIRF